MTPAQPQTEADRTAAKAVLDGVRPSGIVTDSRNVPWQKWPITTKVGDEGYWEGDAWFMFGYTRGHTTSRLVHYGPFKVIAESTGQDVPRMPDIQVSLSMDDVR